MYDYVVIGGGIIGLNVARVLIEKEPKSKIVLIEKESDVAKHSSGRNSGVLHAGFYYSADSLKAKFTKEGNVRLREFCSRKGLSINPCAKIVVAQNEFELAGLEELKRRGDANGVDMEWMSEEELALKYPMVKTHQKALFSPNTATVNPIEVTQAFKQEVLEKGVHVLLNTAYTKRVSQNEIATTQGNLRYKKLINCAGLYADKIAQDFGFAKEYIIIPFKGIYLKDENNICGITTNIYPVPNLANPFLGVHYTLTVDNQVKIGPTAIPAFWRENYKGWDNFKWSEFLQTLYYEAKLFFTNAFGFRDLAFCEMRKYIKSHNLSLAKGLTYSIDTSGFTHWSTPGIRAQLLNTKTLELVQDFVVQGDDKTIHVLNAVSPAFTSSMPFCEWVVENYVLRAEQ
ncbi:MAG: L-2-hydroxyglutarate oxidase [Sulfurospirillaceae bacterium]|nr:L-2-hydroxyglutarate oxidase [Sulfurospirillaceae bacterium]